MFAHSRCLPGHIWFASSPVFTLLTYTMVGGHLGDRDHLIGFFKLQFFCVCTFFFFLWQVQRFVFFPSCSYLMRSGPARQVRLYKFVPVHRSARFCTIFLSLLFVVLWAPPRRADVHAVVELMDGRMRQAPTSHGPSSSRTFGTGLDCVR